MYVPDMFYSRSANFFLPLNLSIYISPFLYIPGKAYPSAEESTLLVTGGKVYCRIHVTGLLPEG